MTTILTIDIGGTKTEAVLWQSSCCQPQKLAALRFTTDYQNEAGLLKKISALPRPDTEAVVLAIAGKTNNESGDLELTNNPCRLNIAKLKQGMPENARLAVLNDLEALAYALPVLAPSALKNLNPLAKGAPNPAYYPQIAAACGTGLGVALRLPGGRVLPSEAGHCRFAPQNKEQADACRQIAVLYQKKEGAFALSNEDILSGRGLAALYAALSGLNTPPSPGEVCQRLAAKEENAKHTLRLFSNMLGAVLGNLALCCLAGGIFLGGGVCQHLAPWLNGEDIMAGLAVPGPFAEYLSHLPLLLITEEAAGCLGAALYAEQRLLG